MKLNLFIFIIFATLFTSCSIQKRTFNKGYFVQWNFKQKYNSKESIPPISRENESSQANNEVQELDMNFNENEFVALTGNSDEIFYKKHEKIENQKMTETPTIKTVSITLPISKKVINKLLDRKPQKEEVSKLKKGKSYILKGMLFFLLGILLVIISYGAETSLLFIFTLSLGVIIGSIGMIMFFLGLFLVFSHLINPESKKKKRVYY